MGYGKDTLLPSHKRSWRRPAWRAYVELLKRTDWPILCGPWRGEVGFEVLYWIPFVKQLQKEGIAPERIIPIGRGGSAGWYGFPQGFELYGMRTPQQVRLENRLHWMKTGFLKQHRVSAFDAAVAKDAAETMRLKHYHVVHPIWMYHVLAPYWTAWRGSEWLAPLVNMDGLGALQVPDGVTLPDPYVCVRFYARETFPYHDKTARAFVTATLQTLLEQTNVVLLDSDTFIDDHLNLPIQIQSPRLFRLSQLCPDLTIETNLAVQSAVLSRGYGFVGTYGGFAQMALRIGKPSMSFYTDWQGTSYIHKHLSDLVSLRSGVPFQVFKLGELAMTRSVLPMAEMNLSRPEPKALDTRLVQA